MAAVLYGHTHARNVFRWDGTNKAASDGVPTLSGSGPLPVGSSVVVTYTVTVHTPDTGDRSLRNAVTTPGDGSCPALTGDPNCTTLSTLALPPSLVATGIDVRPATFLAALLLAIGVALLVARRRFIRRP